ETQRVGLLIVEPAVVGSAYQAINDLAVLAYGEVDIDPHQIESNLFQNDPGIQHRQHESIRLPVSHQGVAENQLISTVWTLGAANAGRRVPGQIGRGLGA